MKTFLVLLLVMLASVAMGVDAVPVPVPAPAVSISVLDWFKANTAVVIGLALAISEVLALIPGIKGNGIVDAIIKALKVLANKEQPPA